MLAKSNFGGKNTTMRTKGVNKEQQLKYILECRNSGLTDYQWCQEHGIHPGTFYNWVSKLKKAGYADIPDPISRLNKIPIKHEIVKLEVTPDVVREDNLPEKWSKTLAFQMNLVKIPSLK